ncbi:GNAT family N-acetyltransferase [Salinibacterium sp. NSLL150]|uniref:GNAT family N-acetyltransferase n=1 Tax=unclassified Salinibacterium TaxID=2632331 RepID=UPI0018CE5FE2|nr:MULTISPECIES: GNAT family N-acetyltransferase [unclassified Salinibacterium]MBH0099920.1 GNAT family N-acetyltransferase [Salinibacterium sp. NSLL35]MBH0102674.1 GNAT family N-acetyltransferase [Salinibacterium sp. NSLL150]MBH0105434.1 GNAT family N-acetyltransferase [Salinibacterium sp. NSLL16]MBH0108194.1 GNAT family N-acetyltransferase [Salinibacterium sp. NSLL17]MBH0110981.1 GNAT family N-acetyltransferase [Salinibacterium sp. NG22]
MKLSLRPRFVRGPSMDRTINAPTLVTDRLTLRPHRADDSTRWYEIQSSPDVHKFTSWPQRDRAESYAHLLHRTKHVTLRQANDFLALGIEHEGQLIGDVALHLRSVSLSSRTAEISWILHPDAYGQGYAREAAEAIMEFAFTEVNIQWLVAVIDESNEASIALAKRLGFRAMSRDGNDLSFVAGSLRE